MARHAPTRRLVLLGGLAALSGCSAVSALNSAAVPLDTYDLSPPPAGPAGRGGGTTLLIARPEASAALTSDRIMVRPDPAAIAYLPAAQWSDEAPLLVQSLLVRTLAGTGRLGYVGRSEGGPVPDVVALARLDAFEIEVAPDGALTARTAIALSLIRDRDQRVIGGRRFEATAPAADDSPKAVVAAFQAAMDRLLPEIAGWTVARV
ncbi:ABC-type transport auxiliary lipoprotein family protein [Oceaniglobus roseus]|uniref:ABC-type transport auxiliary lipoprotein family protein n=1 Tax=Oceaniglobus roseus TaxID=1737570 RepID=UPI000C7F3FF9|nr:ABC-type transport auxiliary lipoprotein family protein [Kandeliimicrobium roseum]